ncbi:hypothetical protein WH50_09570 [Pokkaliibacter plantistimulans]|uniref:DUF6973 domain-containing protein n=2 Tax=Pokkaliibacter plantistimulans TaxID=1635171 RepID=A0ABX5M3M0_9GAMM|nr:hypothetical protein WH50_09570 [Pokkaliibacter plantistimulans]
MHLTDAEKKYLTSHPHHAFAIRAAKDKAFAETVTRFSRNGRNDKSDAFRHCYWTALLARDIGHANAQRFTTAHESDPNNPANEKSMDLHNNAVGLSIGLSMADDAKLSQQCMNALLAGRLQVITP